MKFCAFYKIYKKYYYVDFWPLLASKARKLLSIFYILPNSLIAVKVTGKQGNRFGAW